MHIRHLRIDGIFPITLQLEPSNKCNARCAFCPSKNITRPRGTMSFELCKKIIDEAVAYPQFSRIIWYLLGDPFTDDGFFEKVHYAKEKGVGWQHISTNAALLDQETARQLLDSAINDINISLDGNSKKTYEDIRQGLCFETISENVMRFLEMKKARGQKNPHVSLRTAYTQTTKAEIASYVARWRPLCDQINIASVADWAGQVDYETRRDRSGQRPCECIWDRCGVTWNGNVQYCGDVNGTVEIGNVHDTNIYELWNVPKMQELRRFHQEGRFNELPICAKCDENRYGLNRDARFIGRSDGKFVSLERHNPMDFKNIVDCITEQFDYMPASQADPSLPGDPAR